MHPHASILCLTLLALGCGSPEGRCHPMADGAHMHAHGGGSGEETPEHAHDHHVASMQHDFSDVARFEAMFDAPDRPGWQHPVEVVTMLELAPGSTVADLGTGTGYFLPFLSLAVGARGHVLALDTEAAMIEHVRERARREALPNVEPRVVQAGDPALGSETVDAILVVDTWHHLPERSAYAERLREALRLGGSVLVIDFTTEATRGPPVADRISAETVALELTNAGLDAAILEEDLPDQYAVRGRRPAS
jgi:predicted methyltransferase